MGHPIRFGDYLREVTLQSVEVSYSHLSSGQETAVQPKRLKLRTRDVYRLLQPYLSVRFLDQARGVIPLALYLGLFQWTVLKQTVGNALLIAAGLLAVMLGLMLFIEGLKLGLMPFGEIIGNT